MWSLSNHNANIILYAEPSINRELQRSIAFCAAVCGCLSLTFAASPPAPSEQRGWPVHDEQVLQFLAHFALFYCIPTLAQPWLTAPDGARSAKLRRNSNWVNTPKASLDLPVCRAETLGARGLDMAGGRKQEPGSTRQETRTAFLISICCLVTHFLLPFWFLRLLAQPPVDTDFRVVRVGSSHACLPTWVGRQETPQDVHK